MELIKFTDIDSNAPLYINPEFVAGVLPLEKGHTRIMLAIGKIDDSYGVVQWAVKDSVESVLERLRAITIRSKATVSGKYNEFAF